MSDRPFTAIPLRWRHNGRDSVSNHQPQHFLPNRLFRRRSKNKSQLRVTGLCVGNSPGTGDFTAQMTSNAENVSIWWRHHVSVWQHRVHSHYNMSQNYTPTRNIRLYFAEKCKRNVHMNKKTHFISALCSKFIIMNHELYHNLLTWFSYMEPSSDKNLSHGFFFYLKTSWNSCLQPRETLFTG